MKITKGKLGSKAKKKDGDDDEAAKAKGKNQQLEIKGMEEMHWKIKCELTALQEIKKRLNAENINVFDVIYEPFELYTDVRKRN